MPSVPPTPRRSPHFPLDRRSFLVAGGLSYLGTNLAAPVLAAPRLAGNRTAKSAILIFLSGGASHIDTWDMKPRAPAEYRGTFQPIQTNSPGIELCEHLPLTAQQAHRLAIVRSVGDHGRGTGDHHAGYYYNLTGHAPDQTFHRLLNARTPYPDDWPSVAASESALGHHPAAEGRGSRVHPSGAVRRPVGN